MLKQYDVHPVANIFPMMSKSEFESLKDDIKEHGLRESIVFWKGMLVDGRNRLKACEELGIEPDESELMDETDPVAWVISHNLHRRHLSESQRSMVAAKLANLGIGRPPSETGPIGPVSTEQASTMLNVGNTSTKRAKKVIASGADEVQQAVLQGDISVSAASELVKQVPDKAEQVAILEQGENAVKKRVAKEKRVAPPRAPKSVTQQCENEVNEFLLFWQERTAKGKKAIWLWLVDNYDNG